MSQRLSRRPLIQAFRARLNIELLEERSLLASGLTASLPDHLIVTTATGEVQRVEVERSAVDRTMAEYNTRSDVLSVEYDPTVSIAVIPNDPSFSTLYGLNNTGQTGGVADADIDAAEAWEGGRTGNSSTTVGVIDTGIDYTHPDLYLNVWINQGEIPASLGLVDTDADSLITFYDLNAAGNRGKITDSNGNGYIDGGDLIRTTSVQGPFEDRVDNDGNGYVDDIVGWDFVNNDNDPMDDNGHGTHVSGTIGAIGNNGLGVTGVNWRVQMAGLKFLAASGGGSLSAAVSAVNYAVGKDLRVTNNSWGGGPFTQSLADAIGAAQARGQLFIAAAGNASSNNDSVANYPSNYNYSNVIAVASTTSTDGMSGFSNYGLTQVDLGAPGSAINSTWPVSMGSYNTISGTSMATPHVAGAVALLLSQEPTLTIAQVRSRLLNTVDPIASLAGRTVTGGRLNLNRLLNSANGDFTGPYVVSAVPQTTSWPVTAVRLTFSEPIAASSFTTADISGFFGPSGATAPTSVQAVGSTGTIFDVVFSTAQTAGGSYGFTVGPNVTDLAGNAMDQDQNGIGAGTDSYAVRFTVSPPTTSRTYTSSTPVIIRDLQTVSSTILVPDSLSVTDVNVVLNIRHTYDGDLIIRLTGPDGVTRATLVNQRGGSRNDFTNTVLDDQASRSIATGSAPFTGTYRPETPLSVFTGQLSAGAWTLSVQDVHRADEGTINSWSLVVTGTGGGGGGPASLGGESLMGDGGGEGTTEASFATAAPATIQLVTTTAAVPSSGGSLGVLVFTEGGTHDDFRLPESSSSRSRSTESSSQRRDSGDELAEADARQDTLDRLFSTPGRKATTRTTGSDWLGWSDLAGGQE